VLRLKNTFDTLARMERYRGHFYNWYDTRDLEPLPPRYVSTVDSGNLAGCLVAVKEGCHDLASATVLAPGRWDGLLDTVDVLARVIEQATHRYGTARYAEDCVGTGRRPIARAWVSRSRTGAARGDRAWRD
jgi:hypothetical protein